MKWLKGLLADGTMENLGGLFDSVNAQVGKIAEQVGTTPASWSTGIFPTIRQFSETTTLPVVGPVLTFVICYELIQLLIGRSNPHDVDIWISFKWIFKTFYAILVLSNIFDVVMAMFDLSRYVVQQSAGLAQGSTRIPPDMLTDLETQLEAMELDPLLGLQFQSFFVDFTMMALNIVIFVAIYGRMVEIYLMTSLAPIPLATIVNREIGSMSQNYFRSLLTVGFQGLLVIICIAIYAVLIQGIATGGNMIDAIWGCMGYTVLLCFTLFETGSLAKSIFDAH